MLWKSKLQTCTADSTDEAKLYAVRQSLKLGLGIRLSLIELLELNPTVTTPMFVDNAATVQTSKFKDQISNNNRHIDTRFFKICDHVETGEITVLWCPGVINPADLFTKPLPYQEALPHIDLLLSNIPFSPEVMGGVQRNKYAPSRSRGQTRPPSHEIREPP